MVINQIQTRIHFPNTAFASTSKAAVTKAILQHEKDLV